MKYKAVVMIPQLIEFENPGSAVHVENQAKSRMNRYQKIVVGEENYEVKLMGIYPVAPEKPQPLVFDPPPMVA